MPQWYHRAEENERRSTRRGAPHLRHLDDDLDFAVLVKEHRYWLVALRERLWSRQADPAPVVSRQHPKRAVVPGLRLAQERGSKDERYLGLGLAQFFSLCARQRLARLGRRTATAGTQPCSSMTARTLQSPSRSLSCATRSCRALLRLSDRCGAPDLPYQCAHIARLFWFRPATRRANAPGSFERLGYSKRYFLSEMFVRVAALYPRSTVLPRRTNLGSLNVRFCQRA